VSEAAPTPPAGDGAAEPQAAAIAPAVTGTLHLRELTVARGNRVVVDRVSLDVPPGEVTALLGPNGAGKSSLVLAVGGVGRGRRGAVALDERELTKTRPEAIRQAGVAIVPEGRRLLPQLTVDENLRVATYTLARDEANAARERAFDLFPELKKRLRSPARLLSGGEQQMVVLAQALVSAPKVILIDELSLGLAPVIVTRLIPTLRTICEAGTGVLLIEQFATLALDVARGAYVMNGGVIEFSGTAAELREKPELLHSTYLLRTVGRANELT
jgi:branched-chain amino acid transport system ATP-binding protein